MTQTSNGSITITDLTDITDVYLQYCMAADSITTAAAIIAKTTWTPPEREWSTEYPTWQSGYQIWIREVTKKEGIAQLEYGTPYLDKAVNQINNNISNIQTKIKKIWSDSTGSYMASGIGGNDVTESNVNTYGFNSKSTTTGISFNYNAIPLTTLGTDGLKLYSPVLTNSIITGNRLDATLTSEGLKLLRGGIEAGDKNTNNYIYVYSHDDPTDHTLAINNSGDKSDWRIIAGKNFGVDKAGTLYANEAHISGTFTVKAGSESNIYTKDESDEAYDSRGSASAAQAAAISAAAADATSKANAAEANAKADTTEKLKSYYTKTQTDSAITQSADNILSTVSTTYQTKDDMDDYSTTSEMNSAINQKADSITSTVAQTYATKTQAQGYADTAESNAKTAAATDATNKANTAKQEAIADAASKYYTKTQTYTKSEIEQKAGEISLSVAQEETAKVISVKEASGSIVHIDDAIEYPALSLTATIIPKQSGSGTPSPENIRPISGWTEVEATVSGKNLFNISGWIDTFAEGQQVSFENDTMTVGTTAGNLYTKPFIFSETNTTITLSFASADVGETIVPRFELLNESGSAVGSLTLSAGGGTITRDAVAVRMNWSSNYGFSVTKPQIELGTTATAYEPYTATTHNTDLGRTVYGGTVDVVRGTLTVTRAIVDLGTLNWSKEVDGVYSTRALVGQIKEPLTTTEVPNVLCSHYASASYAQLWAQQLDDSITVIWSASGVHGQLWVRDSHFTDAAAFKTAMSGVQLCYELAEPQTYQLTPQTINTLAGVNNVWADSGNVYLKYATMNPDMQALMNKSNDDLSRAKAEIKVTTDAIESTVSNKVGNNEVISKINQSAETVKIQANKVEIDGTVTFNAIKSQADAAYDSKGSASTAEQNAKGYADGKASTAETNAKTYADGLADDLEEAIPTSVTDLSDGSSYSTTSQMNTAIGNATGTKADKTAALSRSQRIYYRSATIQNLDSFSGPTTWLSTSGTGYGNWSLSIPQLTNGEDAYPYLYTCVQNQTAAQYAAGSVCTCTPVVRDDSTTVIDGGSITTGVVSANYIDAAHLQIGKGQVDGLSEYMSYMTFEDGVLKITKPGFNYSVEIRNDGVYIVDPNNRAIASYKDYITLGTKDGNNIDIRSDSINFNIGDQTYAYAAQDKWFASNAEVSGAMYIDDYSLRQNANGDFVLGRRK